MEKEVKIWTTEIPANEDVPAQAEHTYMELNRESRDTLLKMVNKDWAIMDIMRLKQGDKRFMEFLVEVKDQEKLCRIEEGLTEKDLKRMSLLSGIKDRSLVKKDITEE